MVRFQSWSLAKKKYPLVPDQLWPGVVVPVRAPSMGEKELFNHLLRIIIISYLKLYKCVKVINIT